MFLFTNTGILPYISRQMIVDISDLIWRQWQIPEEARSKMVDALSGYSKERLIAAGIPEGYLRQACEFASSLYDYWEKRAQGPDASTGKVRANLALDFHVFLCQFTAAFSLKLPLAHDVADQLRASFPFVPAVVIDSVVGKQKRGYSYMMNASALTHTFGMYLEAHEPVSERLREGLAKGWLRHMVKLTYAEAHNEMQVYLEDDKPRVDYYDYGHFDKWKVDPNQRIANITFATL